MLPLLLTLAFAACPLVSPPARASGVQSAADTPEMAVERAKGMEERGALSLARQAFLEAAPRFAVGAQREETIARARAIGARLALRDEIAAAAPRDARVFAELGFERVDPQGATFDGKRRAWSDVPIDALARAATAARASREARVGLVHERLLRGAASDQRIALAEMARLVEKGEFDAPDAWHAVARLRGERVPPKGYVFRSGEWRDALALELKAAAAGLEDLAKKLESADDIERDSFVTALRELGPEAHARLTQALDARWEHACGVLREADRGLLGSLAQARRELDEARQQALSLIFDEERYFYPYNPPECPAERAKLYAGVQHEVDERVSLVRTLWNANRSAAVSSEVRDTLAELDWNREQRASRKLWPVLPLDVPAWVEGLDPDVKRVDLATFAWDARERAALELDRALLELNDRRYHEKPASDAVAVNAEEAEQLAVTNEYRRMLGRHVLAWNPKIQEAAQGHSDYMSLTGDFGHDEPDPKRRGPAERLRLAGYKFGGGENCAAGNLGPEGAHVGWVHSSGHHRNILGPKHREMASAISGAYWTQNFGSATEFEAFLPKPDEKPAARPR